jgi:hypothetical protein
MKQELNNAKINADIARQVLDKAEANRVNADGEVRYYLSIAIDNIDAMISEYELKKKTPAPEAHEPPAAKLPWWRKKLKGILD